MLTKGFCPSFVTIEGGELKRPAPKTLDIPTLPAPPESVTLDTPFSAIITGIGGTGVVTIGAILGMAAHLEGKGCGIIDMAGLAQKGGAVTSHIKLAATPDDIAAIRVSAGEADLVLACDTLVLTDPNVNKALGRSKTHVVANTHETMTGEFIHQRDFRLPTDNIFEGIYALVGPDRSHRIDATKIATEVFGNAIAANMFLLGYAFQSGLLPLSEEAILEAIDLNGVAVAMNQSAFNWGRYWKADPDNAEIAAGLSTIKSPETLEEAIARRAKFLSDYQNDAYAKRYLGLIDSVKNAELQMIGAVGALTESTALSAYRIMAYKDEYEVARLLSASDFRRQIDDRFQGDFEVKYHLAPPIFAKTSPATGRPVKRSIGRWLTPVLRTLAKFKTLRGTAIDPFGRTNERRHERALVNDFEAQMNELADTLTKDNIDAAIVLARLPQDIRGFGPVKLTAFERYDAALPDALADFRSPTSFHKDVA